MDTNRPSISLIKKSPDTFVLTLLIVGNIAGDPSLGGLTVRQNNTGAYQSIADCDDTMTHRRKDDAFGPQSEKRIQRARRGIRGKSVNNRSPPAMFSSHLLDCQRYADCIRSCGQIQ